MKIFINGRCLNSLETGIAKYTKELAIHLAKKNNEVTVITNKDIYIDGVKIQKSWLQIFGPLYDAAIFGLQANDADIVFSPANNGVIFSRCKLKVATIHDMSVFDRREDYPLISRYVIKLMIYIAYKFSDIIITVSKFSKDRITRFLGHSKKIEVIYPGLNLEELKLITNENHTKISKGKNFFISTNATHYKRKNIYSLVEAIKRSKYKSKIKLVITGVKFKQISEKFVLQTGYLPRKDLLNHIRKSDMFVYPSFYEGFGFPVLEASLLGTNVLTSNTTSLPEIVFDRIITFNPNDVNEIVKKIDWMIALPKSERKKLIISQKKYAENFTWDKTVNQIEKILNNCLNPRIQ